MDEYKAELRRRYRLSEQAEVLLSLIVQCKRKHGGPWVPSVDPQWVDRLEQFYLASGSGDARILSSLVKKGLAEWAPHLGPYACEATEDALVYEDRVHA